MLSTDGDHAILCPHKDLKWLSYNFLFKRGKILLLYWITFIS